ncbi:hypothetical protein PVAP13_5NG121243 [Panicum virgatum]|uniref:Uncharacterized protein n=1 Tax=Panicum virgatum TaxID=38727 RepID=A0A8T0RL35_PANVG|nr:hypothetical protein PVAP13_5NG121243 [Panicum virgatum]
MVPSRWFCPSTREVSDDKLASNTGMLPVRLLFHKSSTMRRVSSSPNSGGTRPWSWLDQRAMNIRLMQELRLAGSSPEKALLLRSRAWRRCRQPRLSGMPPVMNQLELRLRSLRDDRLPTAGERTPLSPWEGRLRETSACAWLHTSPPPCCRSRTHRCCRSRRQACRRGEGSLMNALSWLCCAVGDRR